MISNPSEIAGLGQLSQITGVNIPKIAQQSLQGGTITRQDPLSNGETQPKHFDIEVGQIGESFSEALQKAIQGVDNSMKTSEQNVQDYVSGKTDNVHEVMISMQRAQLSFQLLTEVRNKAIETYNEISRMQI